MDRSGPSRLSSTFDLNFPPLLTKTCFYWNPGTRVYIVWFGRCNLLKMCILPKYLCLFQALPIKISGRYFKQVHSLFIKLIWAHKWPCLPRHQLSLTKQYGGLALPDVLKYHQVVHLGRLIDWRCQYAAKLWAQIEQAQTDIQLKSALWCYDALPPALKSHPLLGPTIRICSHLFTQASLSAKASPLSPILANPQFLPGFHDECFRALRQADRFQASHFLAAEHWPTITSLMKDTDLFRHNIFECS